MFGLITFGVGQGALVTLVFNVLVTSAPKELAGDVGSLRGTTQNFAGGVGTAIAGALLVGLLSSMVALRLAENPLLPKEIQSQVNLDSINFVSNDRLLSVMQQTTATPEQVQEAVRVECRISAARAQDRPAAHGRRGAADDRAGRRAAQLPAGRDTARQGLSQHSGRAVSGVPGNPPRLAANGPRRSIACGKAACSWHSRGRSMISAPPASWRCL